MQLTILISLMGLVHCSYFAISRDFLRNYDRDDVDYISRLDEGDLEEFYTLVTKNSWPNIRHIDDSHLVMGENSEEQFLKRLTRRFTRLQLLWTPTTLWELFYLANIQRKEFEELSEYQMYQEYVDYLTEHYPHLTYQLLTQPTGEITMDDFYPVAIDLVESIIESVPHHPYYDKYFTSELYRLRFCADPSYLITGTYATRFPAKGFKGIFDQEQRQRDREREEFEAMAGRRHRHRRRRERTVSVYDPFMLAVFQNNGQNFMSSCQSILSAAIQLELKAQQSNKALLFRHSGGIRLTPDYFPSRVGKDGRQLRQISWNDHKWQDLDVVDFPMAIGHMNVQRMQFSYSLLAGIYHHPDKCIFALAYQELTTSNPPEAVHYFSSVEKYTYSLMLSKLWVKTEGRKYFYLPPILPQSAVLETHPAAYPETKVFEVAYPETSRKAHTMAPFADPADFTGTVPQSPLADNSVHPHSPSISDNSPLVVIRNRPDLFHAVRGGDLSSVISQLSAAAAAISRSNSLSSLVSMSDDGSPQPPETRHTNEALFERSVNTFAFRLNQVMTESFIPLTIGASAIDIDKWNGNEAILSHSGFQQPEDSSQRALLRGKQLLANQIQAGKYIWIVKSVKPVESALTRQLSLTSTTTAAAKALKIDTRSKTISTDYFDDVFYEHEDNYNDAADKNEEAEAKEDSARDNPRFSTSPIAIPSMSHYHRRNTRRRI